MKTIKNVSTDNDKDTKKFTFLGIQKTKNEKRRPRNILPYLETRRASERNTKYPE